MNNKLKKLTLSFIALFSVLTEAAAQEVEMADNFRGEGKIFVVVAVILIILVGIFAYLFRLERKIKKLEEEK